MGTIVKSKSNIKNNRQTTGIKNNATAISVYPNPTTGNLFLEPASGDKGKVNVKIISMLGDVLYNETVVLSKKHPLDLSNYSAGTYLLQVTGNSFSLTKRILKN